MSRRRTVAMEVNDNAGCLDANGACDSIASMLAPAGLGMGSAPGFFQPRQRRPDIRLRHRCKAKHQPGTQVQRRL